MKATIEYNNERQRDNTYQLLLVSLLGIGAVALFVLV